MEKHIVMLCRTKAIFKVLYVKASLHLVTLFLPKLRGVMFSKGKMSRDFNDYYSVMNASCRHTNSICSFGDLVICRICSLWDLIITFHCSTPYQLPNPAAHAIILSEMRYRRNAMQWVRQYLWTEWRMMFWVVDTSDWCSYCSLPTFVPLSCLLKL